MKTVTKCTLIYAYTHRKKICTSKIPKKIAKMTSVSRLLSSDSLQMYNFLQPGFFHTTS